MKLKPITIKTLCALSLSLAMPAVFAGNITDINVSSLPDNQKIIKIKFDKDVVSPSGFITTTPARIALDFPGTGIQLAQPVLEYADPLLGQITAAQNNDRARILLALSKAGQYNTQIKGNEVWVYVSEAAERWGDEPPEGARAAVEETLAFWTRQLYCPADPAWLADIDYLLEHLTGDDYRLILAAQDDLRTKFTAASANHAGSGAAAASPTTAAATGTTAKP